MKESIKAFIAEIEKLRGIKKSNISSEKEESDFISGNELTEEEFAIVMEEHCRRVKEGACPYCRSKHVVKYGFSKAKKQRYKCKNCNKYYCITTNTPMYYSKKSIKKWYEYYKLIRIMYPIRHCAKILEISIGTAFQWRHKILNSIMPVLKSNMEGTIEINEVLIPESFKGNHSKNREFQMDRPPVRRKRSASEYVSSKKISILCCKDRQENVFTKTGDRGKIRYTRLYELLSDMVTENSVLCTVNNINYIPLARKLKCKLYKLHGRYEIMEQEYHIQNAVVFGKRIVNTINHKFKGVATKYLNFYLSWFHWKEAKKIKGKAFRLNDLLNMSLYSNQLLKVRDFKFVKSLPL